MPNADVQLLDQLDRVADELEKLATATSGLSEEDAPAVKERIATVREEVEQLFEGDFTTWPMTGEQRERALVSIRRSLDAAAQMVAIVA